MSDDEIKISSKPLKDAGERVKNFFSRINWFNSYALAALFILLLMMTAFAFRAQPADLPAMEDRAEQFVMQQQVQQIAQQLQIENPDLTQQEIQDRANQRLNQLRTQNPEINRQIQQTSNQLKEYYRTDNGDTYLVGIDPYFYWRYVQNYEETGYTFDEKTEDGGIDTYQLAPLGSPSTQNWHPIITYHTHQFLGGLTNWSLYETFFFMPALLSMLAVIPAFFIGRKVGNNFSGLLAGLIIATHQGFVGRSVGGFSSTDGYNVFFPLLILWMILQAFTADKLWKKGVYGSIAGTAIGIFSGIWGGWNFTYFIVLIVMFGYLGYEIAKKFLFLFQNFFERSTYLKEYNLSIPAKIENNWKDLGRWKTWQDIIPNVTTISSVLITAFISLSIVRSPQAIYTGVTQLLGRTGIQDTVGTSLWPNVFTTVAELRTASVSDVIGGVGGPLIFAIAFLGVMLTFLPNKNWNRIDKSVFILTIASLFIILVPNVRNLLAFNLGIDVTFIVTGILILSASYGILANLFNHNEDVNIPLAFFLSVWFAVSFYAFTQGTRFLLLLVPPFGIALSVALSRMIELSKTLVNKIEWNNSFFNETKVGIVTVLILAVFTAITVPVVESGYESGKFRMPQMNDVWYDSLSNVSETTDEDAIITSWWDFGHWFKEVADRRVTFDGASQNTPMAHWTGRLLSTNNYTEAHGIQRMLNCGSRKGFEVLAQDLHGNNYDSGEFLQTKQLMDEAILLDREEAQTLYQDEGVDNVTQVLNLTHCDAPQSLLITSNDMVGKAGVWGYFGNWNFTRSFVVDQVQNQPSSEAIVEISETLDIDSQQAGELYREASDLDGTGVESWISPRPNYLTQQPVSCEEAQGGLACDVQANIGQNRQNQQFRIAGVFVDQSSIQDSYFEIQVVDQNSGNVVRRLEEPVGGVILNETSTDVGNSEILPPFYVNLRNTSQGYEAVVASEELADSVFTDLYFWQDGGDQYDLLINEQGRIDRTEVRVWETNY